VSTADWISAVSNLIVAAAAAAALYIGWRQVTISREISALEAYEDYHRLCIEYPEFSDGADVDELSEIDKKRYVSFVLFVMMTGERVYSLFPNDDSWCDSLRDDFRTHRHLLEHEVFSTFRRQKWLTGALLESVLAEPPVMQGVTDKPRADAPAPPQQ
jgi:hypothetical protein